MLTHSGILVQHRIEEPSHSPACTKSLRVLQCQNLAAARRQSFSVCSTLGRGSEVVLSEYLFKLERQGPLIPIRRGLVRESDFVTSSAVPRSINVAIADCKSQILTKHHNFINTASNS